MCIPFFLHHDMYSDLSGISLGLHQDKWDQDLSLSILLCSSSDLIAPSAFLSLIGFFCQFLWAIPTYRCLSFQQHVLPLCPFPTSVCPWCHIGESGDSCFLMLGWLHALLIHSETLVDPSFNEFAGYNVQMRLLSPLYSTWSHSKPTSTLHLSPLPNKA